MTNIVEMDRLEQLRAELDSQREQIFGQLKEITSFNSVHSVPELAEELDGAAAWVKEQFEAAGFEMKAYPTVDKSQTLLGTKAGDPDAPTVMLYSHYDVVPAGPRETWDTDPFSLTEKDGRWYARGAADCKGNLVMHLAALRAVEKLGGTTLNLKVLIEGSEERGGEGLDHLIDEHPELFRADVILIADSGNAAVGVPTMTTSLRGGGQVRVTVDTLRSAMHSGGFGGAAPDAVAALMRTLDSLRDERGRTVIDGVDCSRRWEGMPYLPEDFRRDAGVLDGVELMGDENDMPSDFVWARPAVTVIGFSSTPVEEAVNAVPNTASAQLNLRVPAGMSAADTAEKLIAHLHAHVPWGAKLKAELTDVNEPFATDPSGEAFDALSSCLAAAYDKEEAAVLGTGGSIPLCTKLQELFPEAEIALYGVEEPQCVIHAPNESVDPQEIRDIAVAEAAFLLGFKQ